MQVASHPADDLGMTNNGHTASTPTPAGDRAAAHLHSLAVAERQRGERDADRLAQRGARAAAARQDSEARAVADYKCPTCAAERGELCSWGGKSSPVTHVTRCAPALVIY